MPSLREDESAMLVGCGTLRIVLLQGVLSPMTGKGLLLLAVITEGIS